MIVTVIVIAVAVVMIAVELLFTGRPWPKVAGWWGRAALLNGVQVASVFLAGVAWDRWFQGLRPWSADALGTTIGRVCFSSTRARPAVDNLKG